MLRSGFTLGLATEHFVTEFTTGTRSRELQRAWEMRVASHLDALGHRLTSPAHGPDFRFEHAGAAIWVEAAGPVPSLLGCLPTG